MLRTSNVKFVYVNSIAYSSIVELGDARHAQQRSNAIAVQKESGVESDPGYSFSDFALFNKLSSTFPPVTAVVKRTTNHKQMINVDHINVTGITASSIMQVGNLKDIQSEARIKHIRILKDEQTDES